MPVFVGHRHLLHNLLDVLISHFNNLIYLRPVRRGVVLLYLKLLAELGDHCIVKIHTIVSNDPLWHTISTYQIMSDKPRHHVLGYYGKRGRFNSLCEVINGY